MNGGTAGVAGTLPLDLPTMLPSAPPDPGGDRTAGGGAAAASAGPAFHVTIGIDPGIGGALAILVNGRFRSAHDMPTSLAKVVRRTTKRGTSDVRVQKIDSAALARLIREAVAAAPGAAVFAAIEEVQPMPARQPGADGKRPSMGTATAFQFGRAAQAPESVLEVLGIPFRMVHASRWKPAMGLKNATKESSLTIARQRHPRAGEYLQRAMDHNRAEAILIAEWAYKAEQAPPEQVPERPF